MRGAGAKEQGPQTENIAIASACGLCYEQCGILVRRQNGVVTGIDGNPQSPLGRGRLCARGLAGVHLLYHPHRLNHPLKRTNPRKGIGVDPRWQIIDWEEALDIIAQRLKRVRAEDPRGLFFCGQPFSLSPLLFALGAFMPAFGSPNGFIADSQAANVGHILARSLHASPVTLPDLARCRYLLLFGSQVGFADHYAMAEKMADARLRGMKVVAVDPYLSAAAEKADEWLPVRPGSEGALACAILNLLLNEYALYDDDYIRHHTDGPYLVGPDGYYVRCQASAKPLAWDTSAGQARPFDEVTEPAIEGSYAVEGRPCQPVFQLLKEQVSQWTPQAASQATTLPADTIRRIAREFGEAANIGGTILIEGKDLPYRPAAAISGEGACGHNNAWLTALAVELLNQVVGASDVPGGLLGCGSLSCGHPQTGMPRWAPEADGDGLLRWDPLLAHEPQPGWLPSWRPFIGWPITTCLTPLTAAAGDGFSFDHQPAVLIDYGSNLLMRAASLEAALEAFQDSFVVSFSLFCDETAEALADIVLPDASYLERLDPPPSGMGYACPAGMGEWAYQIRQPAVEPLYERRHLCQVLLEMSERLGFSDRLHLMTNLLYGLEPPHALNPEGKYSWQEIVDTICKGWFGPEHGLAWFQENGILTWPKRLEEAYWRPFHQARVPLYQRWLLPFGERIRRLAEELGMEGLDTSGLLPLPDGRPCQAFQPLPDYDLQAIPYRLPWQAFDESGENPWLAEICRTDPCCDAICLNPRTAAARGINDGDSIWVEGVNGRRLKGSARLSEGIHPQVVAIADGGGHWAGGMPVAQDRGLSFNSLLAFDLKHIDLVSLALDGDARVKVYKA